MTLHLKIVYNIIFSQRVMLIFTKHSQYQVRFHTTRSPTKKYLCDLKIVSSTISLKVNKITSLPYILVPFRIHLESSCKYQDQISLKIKNRPVLITLFKWTKRSWVNFESCFGHLRFIPILKISLNALRKVRKL